MPEVFICPECWRPYDGSEPCCSEEAIIGCGRLMVGSGTDTYDPICTLPQGHSGSCRSTAAIDQHRLDPDAPREERAK